MRKFHLSKKLKYGSSSVLFTLLWLTVIALIYLLSEVATEKFGLSIDMTQGGIYEVSEQTKDYLAALDEDVTITVLAEQNDYETLQGYAQINELIRKYVQMSHGKVNVRYVNVYKNPGFLQDYPTPSTLREGAVIIESGKRYTTYQIDDFYEFTTDTAFNETYISGIVAEQKLTSGIRFVTMDVLPQIVLVTGHNEAAMAEFDTVMTQNNYQVQSVNLLQGDIPEGTNLVVLNAPQTDFTAKEIAKLDQYLKQPDSTVLYLYSPNYGRQPVLERFAADWGVRPAQELVVDPDRAVGSLSYLAPLVIRSDVTTTLENTTNSILMMSMPGHLELLWDAKSNKTMIPLLRSSDTSYVKPLDKTLTTLEKEAGDEEGAYCLGVMCQQRIVEGPEERISRVLFFSSDTLLSDTFLQTSNLMNRAYATSILNYLYKQEDAVVFEAKTMESDLLVMTGDMAAILFWCLVVALPCLTLLTGLLIWNRRRRL